LLFEVVLVKLDSVYLVGLSCEVYTKLASAESVRLALHTVLGGFVVGGDAEVSDDRRVKDKPGPIELLEDSPKVLLLRVCLFSLVLLDVHERRSLGPSVILSDAGASTNPVLEHLMQLVNRLRRQMDQPQI
jgi:hypothetical protein